MGTINMTRHDDIVFVYGALRSGTTVFRLMLDAHPQISNPGEMDFLFDFLKLDSSHETGWRYNIDAMRVHRIFKSKNLELTSGMDGLDLLGSFFDQLRARAPGQVLSINLHRHVDRMLQVLPQARVLHMLRDPRDVARSSIQMGWAGTLYYGVEHWIETEADWNRAASRLAPDQSLEITYEELFRDIDTTLHAVCDFFDLPFEPAMLRYHENTTYGPPDVSLTEQWRRKCAPGELAELESRAGHLMRDRSYEPSQPQTAIGGVQKLRLKLTNTAYRWRFGMNRFGVMTYWAEKLTRWAGLTSAHRNIKQRMDQIVIQHLK